MTSKEYLYNKYADLTVDMRKGVCVLRAGGRTLAVTTRQKNEAVEDMEARAYRDAVRIEQAERQAVK